MVIRRPEAGLNVRVVKPSSESDLAAFLKKVGVHPWAVRHFCLKAGRVVVLAENLDNRAVNILKQEMLSLGSDAAVSQNVSRFKSGKSSVLVFLNTSDFEELNRKLQNQPYGLKECAAAVKKCLNAVRAEAREICGVKTFSSGIPLLLGILNVTPDSFFDGGLYNSPDKAVIRAANLAAEGADIIDVGGESTRPGSKPVSLDLERRRVLEVVKALCKSGRYKVSIDTVKSKIAEECLKRGAVMVNDISAMRFDKEMVKVVRDYGAYVVLMHMKGRPGSMQKKPEYKDCIGEIYAFFQERIDYALRHGVKESRIILDPGIGFGKKLEHNLEILKRLGEFKSLGLPLLAGLSRKSFIGGILGAEASPDKRLEGGIGGAVAAYENGADLLRVHDVKQVKNALEVYGAIKNFSNFK